QGNARWVPGGRRCQDTIPKRRSHTARRAARRLARGDAIESSYGGLVDRDCSHRKEPSPQGLTFPVHRPTELQRIRQELRMQELIEKIKAFEADVQAGFASCIFVPRIPARRLSLFLD